MMKEQARYKKLSEQQMKYLASLYYKIKNRPPERKWVVIGGDIKTYPRIVERIKSIADTGYYSDSDAEFMNSLKEVFFKLKELEHEQESEETE